MSIFSLLSHSPSLSNLKRRNTVAVLNICMSIFVVNVDVLISPADRGDQLCQKVDIGSS